MQMLLKFAFRNVFKNKKRTVLTASAVFFAALIVSIAMGWINGMIDMMMANYEKYQTGDFRIATENFLKREKFVPVDEIIADSRELMSKIRLIPDVSSAEERIKFGIMLANGDNTVFAFGMGIDLKDSNLKLQEKIIEGTIEESGIYIGKNLAKKLGVKLGDNLLLATKTSEGGLNGIKLPVKGIFKYNVITFDDQFFFISLLDARRLLKIPAGTTELLIYTKNRVSADRIGKEINGLLYQGLSAKNMREQLGNLYDTFEVMRWIYYFIYAIIVFLASFVVVNTMMMAVFERNREIGTLKAMGMTEGDIFMNFLLEGGIIGGLGSITGGALGYIFNFVFNKTGFNFDFAMQGLAVPMEYIIRPLIGPDVLIATILFGVLIPAAATIYPANRAKKLQPAEALRSIH